MKLSALLFATLTLASVAIGFPHQPVGNSENLGHFPSMVPDDLRDSKPQLDRFAPLLPPPKELRREVEAVLEQFASAELKDKLREHFDALEDERRQNLDKFPGLLVGPAVEKHLGDHPHVSDKHSENVSTLLQNLKRPHHGNMDRIPSEVSEDFHEENKDLQLHQAPALILQHKINRVPPMLPEELRQVVEAVMEQSWISHDRHGAVEELKNNIRDHFALLEDEHRPQMGKFPDILLEPEISELLRDPMLAEKRPPIRGPNSEDLQSLKETHHMDLDRFLFRPADGFRPEHPALTDGE